jgi:TetR/AcrR family transcriptional regulator, ethionamide resistance regulator
VVRSGVRARRRSEAERALVGALEQLIVEEPRFTDLTLTRLVEAAGVSRTSFYKYFDGKVDVLASWLLGFVEELSEAPAAWSTKAAPTRAELAQGLCEIVAVYRPRMSMIAATYETEAHDAELRAQLTAALAEAETALRAYISRGKRGGWVNPAVDEAECARWLVYMTENGMRHIIGPASEGALPELLQAWTDIVWFTLYEPVAR